MSGSFELLPPRFGGCVLVEILITGNCIIADSGVLPRLSALSLTSAWCVPLAGFLEHHILFRRKASRWQRHVW